jgi:hypothetical protein
LFLEWVELELRQSYLHERNLKETKGVTINSFILAVWIHA